SIGVLFLNIDRTFFRLIQIFTNPTVSVLKTEQKNNICRAVIDRPNALNAINFEVIDEFEQLLDKIEDDKNTRCFILTGEGSKAFISGGDLREFHTLKTAEEARGMAKRMKTILSRIEK